MTNNCEKCKSQLVPDRVSVYGMFDCHLFHRFEASTVDGLVDAWLAQIAAPYPATVGGCEVDDLGPTSLCPAVVMCNNVELRRVGQMVFPDYRNRVPRDLDALEAYRQALKSDPDISRLLSLQPLAAIAEMAEEDDS